MFKKVVNSVQIVINYNFCELTNYCTELTTFLHTVNLVSQNVCSNNATLLFKSKPLKKSTDPKPRGMVPTPLKQINL